MTLVDLSLLSFGEAVCVCQERDFHRRTTGWCLNHQESHRAKNNIPVHGSDGNRFSDLIVDEWCFDNAGTYAVDSDIVLRVIQGIRFR